MLEGELGDRVAKLALAIAELGQGRTIDPDILAARYGWRAADALVALRLAQEAGIGRVRLRVIGPDGDEVARFDDLSSIPAEVEDDYGNPVRVTPERVEVIFEVGA